MKVKDLIDLLQRCNPEHIVMYDATVALKNDPDRDIVSWNPDVEPEMEFGVDDVLIGSGTLTGFVFLAEDKLE